MRLLDLSIQNIGPFDEARLEFLSAHDDPVPVAIITGENGTGKTILLDAIRGLFGSHYGRLERALWRNGTPFQTEATLFIDGHQERFLSNQKKKKKKNKIHKEHSTSSRTTRRLCAFPSP